MRFVLLGRGKTGSLVGEVAQHRGHDVLVLGSKENFQATAIHPKALEGVDCVFDFTTPHAVLENIAACARARTNMVVGTTGWYADLPRVRQLVEQSAMGFLYAANFSIGVNLFYAVARAAAAALAHGYSGSIHEIHHIHKKDAPSGTAVALQKTIAAAASVTLPITSAREGEVVGTHSLTLDSPNDTITLTHASKSRRGFAEGAVLAAEWLAGKKGFFDFQDVFQKLGK